MPGEFVNTTDHLYDIMGEGVDKTGFRRPTYEYKPDYVVPRFLEPMSFFGALRDFCTEERLPR